MKTYVKALMIVNVLGILALIDVGAWVMRSGGIDGDNSQIAWDQVESDLVTKLRLHPEDAQLRSQMRFACELDVARSQKRERQLIVDARMFWWATGQAVFAVATALLVMGARSHHEAKAAG